MKILLVNQAFYPDTVATGQYLTDLAVDLAAEGHEVSVLSGAHGYDDPEKKFPKKEDWKGISIRRIGYSAFGKKRRLSRAMDFAAFHLGLLWKLLWTPRQDAVVGLTSPPLVAIPCLLFCKLKGARFVYWVMDMNPDEAIAAGWLRERSFTARVLRALAGWAIRRSDHVVPLDRFMKKRMIEHYGADEKKITVIAPWSQDEDLHPVEENTNDFLKREGLGGRFAVMYAGNHSPCHPLDTLLDAAAALKDKKETVFYFIGGGTLTQRVTAFKEKYGLSNVIQRPYEPRERLSHSLSAASVHVVVMGEPYVGIVHPCKIYGILSVGRPFVFIGPEQSAMADLIRGSGLGVHVKTGDTTALVRALEHFRSQDAAEKKDIEQRSLEFCRRFSRSKLSGELIGILSASDKNR